MRTKEIFAAHSEKCGKAQSCRGESGEWILCALAVLFLMLAGCAKVGPDYVRPDVSVSQRWIDAADSRVKSEAADYRSWWKTFNDPVLDRLIEDAYKGNLSLRIAGVRVLESRAQLGIAVGELVPQTQATGSVQYNRLSAAGTSPIGAREYTQSQIGLSASWELDFWGRFRRSIESADAGWRATVADYDNALVSLTADVANTYIGIRTFERRITIARQNAEIQKNILNISEARFKHGTVTQLDVEQARTALNDTLAAIPSLEAQLRQAKHALSILLGRPPSELSEYLDGISEIPVSPPVVAVGIPVDLLRRRPDIRSAEYQAASQSARIGVAKADLYPAFSLSGIFGFLSTSLGAGKLADMFKWSSRDIHAGTAFQWSIFNYGRIANNVRLQDARFQELLIAYQNAVLAAQREVEDNLAAFLRAQERSQYLAQSAASARKALDIAVIQYREGVRDFTTVLIAQQALLAAQDNLAVTLGNISINLVGVYKALGGGWEIRDGGELVPPEIAGQMARRTNWGELLSPASYNPSERGETTSAVPGEN